MSRTRVCMHTFMLDDFAVQDDVRENLVGTGCEHYLDIHNSVAHCSVLIEVLMSMHSSVSGCFEIRGQNLYFRLVDVLNIMGFPIVGKPITGKKKNLSEMCRLHFGNYEEMVENKGLSLKHLKEIAMSQDKSLEMRTKVTVLFLVGTVLVPDTSGTSVKPIYCSFLDDIDSLKDYTWSMAAHALLHSSLSEGKKNLSGCAFAIMIFAFIHIPNLVGYVGYTATPPTPTFPLIKGWITALNKTSRKGQPRISKERLTTILRDELELDSFVWNPYQDLYQLSDNLFPRLFIDRSKTSISIIFLSVVL